MNNSTKIIKLIILSTIIAGLVGMGVHIFLSSHLQTIIATAMAGKEILHPPYPSSIKIWAFLTALLPALGTSIIYYLLLPYLRRFQLPIVRGILFTALMLFAEGALIRQPIMNILVGNPVWLALLQQGGIWLPRLCMGIIIAYIIQPQTVPNRNIS